MKAFIKILKYLLKRESELVLAARVKGMKVLKPTAVALLFIGHLYLWCPYDLLAEAWLSPIIAYLDDIIVVLSSISYFVMDLINFKSAEEADDEVDESETESDEEGAEESEVEE